MDFREWLIEVRKQKGWDVRTFGAKTGLDSSTISRIEIARNHASFYTAFRVCEGLGVSLYDLVHILRGKKLQFLLRDNLKEFEGAITLEDVKKVVDCFHKERNKILKEIVVKLNELHQELNSYKRNYNKSNSFDNEEIVSAACTFHPYSMGEVDRLLFPSPLVQQYQLRYPAPIKINFIIKTYEQNGILMIQDAEAFLKKIKPGRPFAAYSAPLASIERIKLLDILRADEEGKQEGRLIGVYWEACRFYSTFSPFGKFVFRPRAADQQSVSLDDPESSGQFVEREEWELRLATLYLTICRWEQYLGKDVKLPTFLSS